MPYMMKIQPIDSHEEETSVELVKPVVKSRLKRLFERQFAGVLRNSAATEKIGGEKDGSNDLEPSSVCLAKMVQNFMEGNHDKHSISVNSSDAESDAASAFGDSSEILKVVIYLYYKIED